VSNEPTDYRKRHRKQERFLLILVVLVLVGVGTGLIYLIWGLQDAIAGIACLLPGAALIVGLWFLLSLIEKIALL
jgi:ABC-type thiamin/hydroxymethylpyrimidine transport system permease subunit